MLSIKTQEALKAFLEGVKNETGMDVTDINLYQYKQRVPSQKQMGQMKDLGFEEDNNNGTYWLNNKSKVMVDGVEIGFTCFYTPEEIPEPLTYCTAEGCLDEPDPDSEDGLCTEHMEKQVEEWEAEQKQQDYEYKQSKV